MVEWLISPDGTVWHPSAQIFGRNARLILSTIAGSLLAYVAEWIFGMYAKAAEESPIAVLHPVPPQIGKDWKGECLESTSLLDPKGQFGLQIRAFDASTGWHLGTFEADTKQTIDTKLDLATSSAELWAKSPWPVRRRVLKSILEWVISDQDTIIRVACRDTGKTAVDAFFGEILTTSSKLKYLIKESENALKPRSRPNGNWLLAHKRSVLYYKPFGVVLASVSWNYPFHNILGPITAALASGNAIVVKPSEHVAFSTIYYVQCLQRILQALKLPTNLISLVLCHPPLAPYLSTHPQIKHITFIGSETVGRKVMLDAAANLTPVTLELGGKDPAVILSSTKIKEFASTFLRSVFQSAGQNCIGIERFIVHESLVEQLLDVVVPRVKKLKCGSWMQDTPKGRLEARSYAKASTAEDENANEDGVDYGAMITVAQFNQLEKLIADAVEQGARLHTGGKRLRHPKWPGGHYFQPTVLSHVKPDMTIAQNELFGPVFLIMSFQELTEAVELANGTRMGLGSSIFGNDKEEVDFVRRRLECGMVNVNDFGVSYLNQSLPFGGVKASGFGRFAGEEGLRGLCYTQAVVEDVLFRSVRTSIPPPVDYPIRDSHKSFAFVGGLHHFAFAQDLTTQVRGLWTVIREAMRK